MKYFFVSVFLLTISTVQAQTKYENFCGYAFCVDLPVHFKITDYDDNNMDHSFYEVSNDNGKLMEINSLLESRYSLDKSVHDISSWFEYLLKTQTGITYKMQADNWFVLSGIDEEKGNIFYWKKIWKGEYISDLYIEYPQNRKNEIEPYISTIAKSFMIQ